MSNRDLIDERDRAEGLLDAQRRAAELFAAVESEQLIQPGMLDSEASDAVTQLAADRFGCEKHWHKRIVRSGPNTLEPYNIDPPDRTIDADDIIFGDFGPVFDDWEGDFGRTWVLGNDPDKLRLRDDLPVVFDAGKRFFQDNAEITAEELFAEVVRLTRERGWEFGNIHCGHLVGEYPHENFPSRTQALMMKGNTLPIRTLDPSGRIAHWILEVHLVDREKQIGGFYEELLTL